MLMTRCVLDISASREGRSCASLSSSRNVGIACRLERLSWGLQRGTTATGCRNISLLLRIPLHSHLFHQIWGANPAILTPDSVIAWTELKLGPTYLARHGDTLDLLASRFGTSSTNILEANPDIPVVNNTGVINVGQSICILPRVCWSQAQSATVGTFTQVL
mmetsp:Transcript_2963/g.7135  ORF Transcript_2963/g.7135 Transcript_2963/m.7135 type:complete len:162 (-) Transcript_2963:191-676(-)